MRWSSRSWASTLAPMFVRTASRRDVEAIRTLLVETWHATYDAIYGAEKVDAISNEWHSAAALAARVDRPNTEFLVADDGSAIGGVAFAELADGDKIVMLRQLYVRPDHQGHGIGSMLLDEIESCFSGAKTLRLEVEEANGKAVAFYLSHGFAKTGGTENCGAEDSAIPAAIYERPILWDE